MPHNNQGHKDEAHEDQRESQARHMASDEQAQRASDQAHLDMQQQDATAKRGNPFSLTNILLAIALAVGTWMANQIWGTLQDSVKSNATAMEAMQAQFQLTHETLLIHGVKLDSLQMDVTELKKNCMDKDRVDERIRSLVPHATINSGAALHSEGLVSPQ